MKKRVTNSEIEIAKKSSRVLFSISFILLVLLFLGFGLLYAMDVDVLSFIPYKIPQEENTRKESKTKKTKVIEKGISLDTTIAAVEVDIEDGNVKRLFNIVKTTNMDVCIGTKYHDQRQVLVSQLPKKCKFSIASNIYSKQIQKGLEGKIYVKEEDVKNAYEELFGNHSYEKQDSIPWTSQNSLIYNDGYYFTEKTVSEQGSSLVPYEKPLYAIREGEKLDITSVTLYYEKVLSLFCKDSLCNETIGNAKKGYEYDDEFLNLYVEYNKDELYQYTYHFEMDASGFYRYVGYERTNE